LTQILFDPTQRYFFDPKRKKLKNLGLLGEIFKTQTKTRSNPIQPEQQKIDPTQNNLSVVTIQRIEERRQRQANQ